MEPSTNDSLRRGFDGKRGRVDSNPVKMRPWADLEAMQSTGPVAAAFGGQDKHGHVGRTNRNPSVKGVRSVPVRTLQEMKGALVAGRQQPEVTKAENMPVGLQVSESSVLILSGDLDQLVSFGDIRSYVGPEASQCTIRRSGQEFALQFQSPEAARSCLASAAAEWQPTDQCITGGQVPGKPLTKGGKQRRVFIRMHSTGNTSILLPSDTRSLNTSTQTKLPTCTQELQISLPDKAARSTEVRTGSADTGYLASPKESSNAHFNKPAASNEKHLQGSLPSEKQPGIPSISREQHLETEPLSPTPSTSPEPQIGVQTSETRSLRASDERATRVDFMDKQGLSDEGYTGDELLVQETLRLLMEKARFQKEAQEKGRLVARLQGQIEMLQEELDNMHSRLSDSLGSENVWRPTAVVAASSQPRKPIEEGSKKRKKSGTALSPLKAPESSSRVENSVTLDDFGPPTGWDAEKIDVAPTGWGDESGMLENPQRSEGRKHPNGKESGNVDFRTGGINTGPSAESGPSGHSGRNKHRRAPQRDGRQTQVVGRNKAQGTRKPEGSPRESEGGSGSSEATDPRTSRSSSAGGFWEENTSGLTRNHYRIRTPPSTTPQWDVRSSTSSVGDGGMTTPPLQEGEWEWPVTPGKPPAVSSAPSDGNRNLVSEHVGGEGLLPIPTGWEDKSVFSGKGLKRFEAGEGLMVGTKSPGEGRRGGGGRAKENRARKKSVGEKREGDYAGAPRERGAMERKWPRGMVT